VTPDPRPAATPGRPHPHDPTRGATLIELLVAVTLLGITVVAVMAGLGTSLVVSDVHRKETTAGAEVRSFAEQVENLVTAGTGGYLNCATTSSYPTARPAITTPDNPGYTRAVTAVKYWTGSAWTSSCGTDIGLQKLTLQVAATDGRATETLDLVVRKPCSTGQTAC
jgi:type II secretory pathway pseudopilin PulG